MRVIGIALGFGGVLLPALLLAHPGHGFPEADVDTSAGALPASRVEITLEGDQRVIRANGLPNHATGQFPNRNNPNAITEKNYIFRASLHPQMAARPTSTGYA